MKRFQNKFIIGIDHGYGNIKTASHCFPNGIDSSDINPILTKDILIYNGQDYQICQGHKPFLADKQDDDDYYILTLAAIAMELNDLNLTEAEVIIAAGLPLKWAKNKSEAFRAYLSRNEEVCFAFRNVTYRVRISDVLIYPQGFAAIAPFKSKLEGLNMIADIGNGTLSSFFIADGKVLKDEMYMDLFGTQQCTQKIRDAFFAQTGRSIKDYTIESILRTGKANIPEKDLELIRSVAEKYVKDIFDMLYSHGYDENTMLLYIIGGGGCLVRHFYQGSLDRIRIIDDIRASAKGYEYIAEIKQRAAMQNAREV